MEMTDFILTYLDAADSIEVTVKLEYIKGIGKNIDIKATDIQWLFFYILCFGISHLYFQKSKWLIR